MAWPLQVDAFIAVGELALFVALADSWSVRSRTAAWTVTVLGLAVSVAGNVGHLGSPDVASHLTAAAPPLGRLRHWRSGLARPEEGRGLACTRTGCGRARAASRTQRARAPGGRAVRRRAWCREYAVSAQLVVEASARLDAQLANVRRDCDAGDITVREAADERVLVLEEHLSRLAGLREEYQP
jgi:hypothetical protein